MGRVRNDILNGWKEIGGYVCRDIRTVERWEKQRGLPVRRVPGAGRATVYALIPELDEWLARNHAGDSEETSAKLPLDSRQEPADASSLAPEALLVGSAVESSPGPDVFTRAQPVAVSPSAKPSAGRRATGRFKLRASVAFAAAAASAGLCAILWPIMVQARRGADMAKLSEDKVHGTGVPYGSHVAGVDDLYLRGVYFYEQRTPDSLERSEENFQKAIAKDAGYAPAYAGLANTYNLQREYSRLTDAEAYPKAKAAAERAIQLDPKLPQAHASLGFIDFFWSWDAAAAEREFQTALALDPSSVLAHHWYGSVLAHEGRFAEANQQLALAQRLQPTSSAILSTHALAMGMGGKRDEAVEMLQEVLNNAPSATSPHAVLGILSLVEPRNPERFLAEVRKVAELRRDGETLRWTAAAQTGLRAGGEPGMWKAILETEEQMHPEPGHRTYQMAEAEAALGHTDQAFADLEQLAARRDPATIGIELDPTLAPLRLDPRFTHLLRQVGIPDRTSPLH